MVDVIIPVIKNGSRKNDVELLYCLRSVEKHLRNYGNIVIIGHLPDIINPESVVYIPFKDGPKKQANIRSKIIAAFEHTTDTVLFTNDDIMLVSDLDASSFPYYYSGDLRDTAEKAARHFAYNELKEQGLPTKHFDIHFPILYKKNLFIESSRHYSDEASIKSTYANHWHIEGVETKDLKINSSLREWTIREAIEDRICFSVGDYGVTNSMLEVLNSLYPDPSKYESKNQIKAA